MASDLSEGPVTLDMFRVGQVWEDEEYDGTFTVIKTTKWGFKTIGWGTTRMDHNWTVYDDQGMDDDYGDMSIIRRWALVSDVSDETPDTEPKGRWGVIDLDWLQSQVAIYTPYGGKGHVKFGAGCLGAFTLVQGNVVEL